MGHPQMSTTLNDDAIISAAIEFIRVGGHYGDGCVVRFSELFEELEDKFGVRVSPEQLELLDLIQSVAVDPRVAVISDYGIEFAWAGENNIELAHD
jgi:hypothetical protein